MFTPSYEFRLKEEKRKQNEELREQKRKDEEEESEKLRSEQLLKAFTDAKKTEDSNHKKFVEKIYISFRPLDIPDIPKYQKKSNTNQRNQRNDDDDDDFEEMKRKVLNEKTMKAVTRSERIWRSADCSETSYPREIKKLKISTYEYGKKKLIEEFKGLAFNDDSWVIKAKRKKSFSDSSRSSSVPPIRRTSLTKQ
jgi:hypothetical protein